MLYEFAVEPSLLNNWGNFRYFIEKFGYDRGRLISQFPKKWKRMVFEASANASEMELKRISARLQNSDDFLIASGRQNKYPDDWLKSADAAHMEKPFHAILARKNPENREYVLEGEYLDESNRLFLCPIECQMPKTVEGFVAVSQLLLQCSKKIIFVDPYFTSTDAWGKPLKAMLQCIRPGYDLLQYCTSASPAGEALVGRCKELDSSNLKRFIPDKLSLEIVLLEKVPGQDNHNRYILTERGGLKFSWGLDARQDGSTDIVNLMDENTSKLKFEEFFSPENNGHSVTKRLVVGSAL